MPELSDEQFAAAERYWAAFGRFINYFSQVEQRLHSLLWELSGAPLDLVRVAFAEARFSQVANLINRLYQSRGEVEHPLYRRAVDQLGLINSMRNDMVHLGAAVVGLTDTPDAVMIVSNEIKAIPGKEKSFRVNIEMLNDMSRDLRTAMACLTVVLSDRIPIENRLADALWRVGAQDPWRYKPQQQSGRQAKHQRPFRKRPPQQKPSEG
jgi:hypothetical protein